MMTPFMTATPNSAMKPTPEATLRVVPVRWSAISPPSVASGTTPRISSTWRSSAELGVEQHHHQPQHQADDQLEARLGALLALELSAPFEMILAVIERHLVGDAPCRPRPRARLDRGR